MYKKSRNDELEMTPHLNVIKKDEEATKEELSKPKDLSEINTEINQLKTW